MSDTVIRLRDEAVPHARAMLEHAEREEIADATRRARVEAAREAYAAAKARIMSWPPGDTRAAIGVMADVIGAADRLIEALDD